MKTTLKVAAVIIPCMAGLLIVLGSDSQEIFIESQESKTINGEAVFNKIKWFQFKDKDVWMMNQSHHGPQVGAQSWDRLAIAVDKTQSPPVARFYQLEPGPLEWKESLAERPFKVSCFMCHNNGPRLIRPNDDSPFSPTGFKDRLKISYWNLRIRLYGRVIASSVHDDRDHSQLPPFRFRSTYENEPLQVATCMKCHKESGFLARGLLRRQQLPTIKFMLESGLMPPFGFDLSSKEKEELKTYITGF